MTPKHWTDQVKAAFDGFFHECTRITTTLDVSLRAPESRQALRSDECSWENQPSALMFPNQKTIAALSKFFDSTFDSLNVSSELVRVSFCMLYVPLNRPVPLMVDIVDVSMYANCFIVRAGGSISKLKEPPVRYQRRVCASFGFRAVPKPISLIDRSNNLNILQPRAIF